MLLYRRNKTNGSWIVKASDGHGAYWTKAFAQADDFDDSDGKTVLTFYEAPATMCCGASPQIRIKNCYSN
jgi:hypothetical protein